MGAKLVRFYCKNEKAWCIFFKIDIVMGLQKLGLILERKANSNLIKTVINQVIFWWNHC